MQVLKAIWDFFQNQILGMKWLNEVLGSGLAALGLDTSNRWVGSIQFFIYDVVKITILLCFLIFLISYIQSYFPPERSKRILGRFRGIGANCVAALLGTVTPFCSCSSIPLFIGFTSAGLPLGVTFSFLISSPMVDLGSLLLLMGIFGWKVAVIYVVVGLIIAVIGGTLIEKLHMEKHVESFILTSGSVDIESPDLTRKDRLVYAKEQMLATFKKVLPYILIGVGIGAIIHNWIPEEWVATVLGDNNPFGVLLATLIGIPMYADIFGTIPIAEALLGKGALLGTVLSFMMAVTTLSLPSIIMLRKGTGGYLRHEPVIKPKETAMRLLFIKPKETAMRLLFIKPKETAMRLLFIKRASLSLRSVRRLSSHLIFLAPAGKAAVENARIHKKYCSIYRPHKKLFLPCTTDNFRRSTAGSCTA